MKIEMKVKDYVLQYNDTHEEKITRHDVYAMIKEGKLKAHKGTHGAWIIELEEKKKRCAKEYSYSVKEFVEKYNKKHSKNPVTVSEVRRLIAQDIIKAEKVSGKYVVKQCPCKKVK